MVDIFALAVSHGLLALVAIRLLSRPQLDDEGGEGTRLRTIARLAAGRAKATHVMKVRPDREWTDRDA